MGKQFTTYIGGMVSHFDHCESDMMSLVELNAMAKELGCIGLMNYHCLVPKVG